MECFKGKRLTIISDCSYSGSWVKECARVYDSLGILYCGHHSREKGILVKVFASCQSYQQATILTYVKEAMEVVVSDVVFDTTKKLSTGQQGVAGDFTMIRCNNKPDEQCEYNCPNQTWTNKLWLSDLVYLVHGKNRGKEFWHYVLVDEDKVEQFKKKINNGCIIYLAKYGKVLYSGWGKDHPQDIKDKIDDQF